MKIETGSNPRQSPSRRDVVSGALLAAGAGVLVSLSIDAANAAATPVVGPAAKGHPKRLIDFRARPNTEEYMKSTPAETWNYPYPRPGPVPLSDYINSLDRAGVSKAVFTGRQSGFLPKSVWISNDYIASCVASFPDRIVGIGGINPLDNVDAVKEADRALKTLKLKGLMVDLVDVSADDRRLYPIYHKCLEYDVPIVLTAGPRVGPGISPEAIFRVATDLPDLKIVCSHAIYPKTDEFIALAHVKKNIYIEASVYHYMPGSEDIMQAASSFLQDRVIYASGFPFADLTDYRYFQKYPFKEDILDKIYYSNAAALLKIDSDAE